MEMAVVWEDVLGIQDRIPLSVGIGGFARNGVECLLSISSSRTAMHGPSAGIAGARSQQRVGSSQRRGSVIVKHNIICRTLNALLS